MKTKEKNVKFKNVSVTLYRGKFLRGGNLIRALFMWRTNTMIVVILPPIDSKDIDDRLDNYANDLKAELSYHDNFRKAHIIFAPNIELSAIMKVCNKLAPVLYNYGTSPRKVTVHYCNYMNFNKSRYKRWPNISNILPSKLRKIISVDGSRNITFENIYFSYRIDKDTGERGLVLEKWQ